MNATVAVRRLGEPWRVVVCAAVVGFLALGAATHSFRLYHLFMLLAIPAAVFAAEGGRRFFLDWAPLAATWLTYDRFRLVQTALLERVFVTAPLAAERAVFGWLTRGEVPPHAARAWLAAHAASPLWGGVVWGLQVVYLSHIFVYPALFLWWWIRGRSRPVDRERFARYVPAFVIVNVLGFVGYVLFPAAPPWWVSLHGTAQPTPELVASANLALAMDGAIIRHTIATAPNWFAAVPSLHGGYPVLLFMLAWRERKWTWLSAIALFGVAMWIATVALNQHYVVDLVAGAAVAVAAYWLSERLPAWCRIGGTGGGVCADDNTARSS